MSEIVLESTLTCPSCGHAKTETMPTDACQWFYECEHCHGVLKPKPGDCCVYCSYGTQPCPPVQEQGKFGGEVRPDVDEVEVYLTPDGLGRAAIARRTDGLFCIYVHWKWSKATLEALDLPTDGPLRWAEDQTPLVDLYRDKNPEIGIFGTLDVARRELRGLPGFSEAALKG